MRDGVRDGTRDGVRVKAKDEGWIEDGGGGRRITGLP